MTATATQEFLHYVAGVRVIQRRYRSIRRQALAAFDIINASGPDQTWTTAGRRLRILQQQLDQLGAETTNLTPPASLHAANRKLVSSFAGFSQYYDGVASSLLGHDLEGFSTAAHNTLFVGASIGVLALAG